MKVPSDPFYTIPLSTYIFNEASRPRRQQAAFLSELYYEPPRALSKATLAHRLIANIVTDEKFESHGCARLHVRKIFPCPNVDAIYACLLARGTSVKKFRHCRSVEALRFRSAFSKRSLGLSVSRPELAYDQNWFTILFVGEDAQAQWEYAMRSTFSGSPLGGFNLFDKKGFNLLKVSIDNAGRLVQESSSIYAIMLCDIGKVLARSGRIKYLSKLISNQQKVVALHYFNLDESERWASNKAYALSPDKAEGEAWKVIRAMTLAQELAQQVRQAPLGSKVLESFFKSLDGMEQKCKKGGPIFI